ncbi:hypothetical protein ACORBP_004373 [Vibrio vulnificus]
MAQKQQKTRSEEGYDFQFDQAKRIMDRLSGYSTVRFEDLEGRPLSLEKKGRDGGLDMIIKIEAKTSAAEKRIHTLVKTVLSGNDY